MKVCMPTTESSTTPASSPPLYQDRVRQETLALTQALIKRCSVTPEDAGCQALISTRLRAAGFGCHSIPSKGVQNLWAIIGSEGPLLALAGHTDVVPSGPEDEWASPPFQPTIRDQKLFGRGAADMKGGVAAMVSAAERLAHHWQSKKTRGRLAVLLTSDEEGPAKDGTQAVLDWLRKQNEQIDYCLIGEPSSDKRLGDRIRIGRRGSMNVVLRVYGRQGHVAYPDQAQNPISGALALLSELATYRWDEGDRGFPPTQLQITNIKAGQGVTNVIPDRLEVWFNLRFNPKQTKDGIEQYIEACCKKHCRQNILQYDLDFDLSGEPFLSESNTLTDVVEDAIAEVLDVRTTQSTGGGTSDGRFIAKTGAKIVEFGLINESIHQINEHCLVDDLGRLSLTYEKIISKFFSLNQGNL